MDESTDLIEALARLPTLGSSAVAADGRSVAFYYDVTGRNELHVLDVSTGERERWSAGDVPRDAFVHLRWDDARDRVLFHRDDGGDEQYDIYALSSGGTAKPVVAMDGQAVLYDVGERNLLFGCNRDGQMNAYAHDLFSGDTTKLTNYDRAIWRAILSPDEEQFAYATNETNDFDNRNVYVANIDGSNPRNLHIGEAGAEARALDWTDDGSQLLVSDNTTDMDRSGIYDLETEMVQWLGDDAFPESPVAFHADEERIVTTRQRAGATVPAVYDVESGDGRELALSGGVSTFGNSVYSARRITLADGRLLLRYSTPDARPVLLAYDLATDEYEVLLEADYGTLDRSEFVDATYFTFRSDGIPETPAQAIDHEAYEELHIGALFFDSGERPSPLVVNPHGGPRSRSAREFSIRPQVLAMHGFSVLQVNYRGSAGRGREFAEELIGDWGGAEQGDVAVATEYVLEEFEWIDEDSIAVFGGSYGGYSAYWQAVQFPDLYEAVVAWIGLTDLEGMYENTVPQLRTELMEKYLGHPDENPDLYAERSPINYVENVEAPMLVIHGVNDTRVPVSQARRFRDALEAVGFDDFVYEELGEEGHGSTDQQHQLRLFDVLVDFLEIQLTN